MFSCQLGYRHENGEVEGFVGTALTDEAAAERDCIQQIQRKCEMIKGFGPSPFSMERVIRSDTGLTAEEVTLIKQDWKEYSRY